MISCNERIIYFKYKKFKITCWIELESYFDIINYKSMIRRYKNYIKETMRGQPIYRDQLNDDYYYRYLATALVLEFNMLACEVVHKNNNCGFIYYRE